MRRRFALSSDSPMNDIILLLVAAVLLGGAGVYVLNRSDTPALADMEPTRRARIQLRESLGRAAEVRYVETGAGLAICGYAGLRGKAGATAFISRPRRLLLETDPLSAEFNEMMKAACPGFARLPPATAAP